MNWKHERIEPFRLCHLPCMFLIQVILELVPKTGAKFWHQFSGTRIW